MMLPADILSITGLANIALLSYFSYPLVSFLLSLSLAAMQENPDQQHY